MPVRKKVLPSVVKFISKGADVKVNRDKSFKNILIRVPNTVLIELDDMVQQKPWLSRTQWIVEAILDKIKREIKEEERAMKP